MDDVGSALLLIAAVLIGAGGGALLYHLLARRRHTELERSEARLQTAMQEFSHTALRHNSEQFLTLARESFGREQAQLAGSWRERELALSALVDPINSALQRSEAQVENLERDRRDAFSSLRTQIESLNSSQSLLQQETRKLVTALRRPEVRGRWGEITLRRVVELSGMSSHCDFSEQYSLPDSALRPDLVVHLPEGLTLVVDAKTPLDAYLDAIDAATEELRAQALTRHAQQVEARVRELGSKTYWQQLSVSPQFTVLFLPGDQFWSAALAERPQLMDNALRTQVIVATPSTLIALLKTAALGWRQMALAQNAAQIRDLGQDLHRRLGSFIGHLSRLAKGLNSAVDSYNSAVGSFDRQVMPGARKFTELGAATGEELMAPELIERVVRVADATLPEADDPALPPL